MHNKILIVDDSIDLRELLEEIFSARGYNVTTACSGLEALESIRAIVPDLIFVDYQMDIMNGEEFITELQSKFPMIANSVPIIMLTALDRRHFPTCEVTEIIQKMTDVKTLMGVIHRYLQPIIR